MGLIDDMNEQKSEGSIDEQVKESNTCMKVCEDKSLLLFDKIINTPGRLCAIAAFLMFGICCIIDVILSIFVGEWNVIVMDFLSKGIGIVMCVGGEPSALFYVLILGAIKLIGFILMIVLRVKYPKYKKGKILMWITIADIAYLIFILTFVLSAIL